MLSGIVGSEIAEIIWPVVKVAGIVGGVLLAARMTFKRVERGGATKATAEMQEEAERGRIEFEKDRLQERESAMARWSRRRAELAGSRLPRAGGSDGGDDS